MSFFSCDAFAQSGASPDIIDNVVTTFFEKSNAWGEALQKYAISLFRFCAILTIALFGVKAVLHRHQLGEILGQFVMTALFCGFIFAVINNYHEWSWNIINGLKTIAGELGPSSVNSKQPLAVGYNIAMTIIDKINLFSISDIGKSLAFIVAGLVIIVAFALMTAQVVLIKCEAFIVLNASMILLGLGGLEHLKEYAINVMRYVLSVAFKLFVLQLVLGMGLEFIQDMTIAEATFEDIFIIIAVAIVLLALVKSLPDAVASVINGSHVGSGSALGQAAAAVAGGAVGAAATAIGMGVGGGSAAMAVKKAAQTANASDSSGLGKVGQFGKALYGAHRESRFEEGKVGHMDRVSANVGKRLQEMKMQKMANDGSDDGKK